MRLTSLLITKSIIICNILLLTSADSQQGSGSGSNGTFSNADGGGGGGSSSGGAASPLDKQPLKYIYKLDKPQPPPPPLLISPASLQAPPSPPSTSTSADSASSSSISSISSSSTLSLSPSISSTTTTTTTITTTPFLQQQSPTRLAKHCPAVNIRNDLKSFDQLRGCNIIDGPLTIALISNSSHPYEAKDYENITFPDLIEITDYLLFFRVQGLTTFARLFPNLSVIRGQELASNYALIIYEMLDLQKINLPRLADILRGSVRIEKNPNLCYVSTVNWDGICKHVFTPHFFKDNNHRCSNHCPEHCRPWNAKLINNGEQNRLQGDIKELGAENNRSLFCWSNQQCQEMCQTLDGIGLPLGPKGGCCSPQCAGGCRIEDRSDECYTCRSVKQEDKCVEHCDYSLYEYKGTCINEQACILTVETSTNQQHECDKSVDSQISTSNLKAVRIPGEKHGRCQVSCPPGYEEDPTNNNKCKPCDKGKCRKVCTFPGPTDRSQPFTVDNVNSLRELSGCNVINGSLEISLKGGKNVLLELETAFQDLEEIRGYLRITRSYPIITLGFLRKLKAINGSELDRGQYSLIIIDNPNLQELFLFNKNESEREQLNILKGKIFVHLNPKLCPHRIDRLKTYASVADWDERDVSPHTNGDKEACNTLKLEVNMISISAKKAALGFDNFAMTMDDPRSLLFYLIIYREVPVNGTVTMFDGKDGCNSQNDVWYTQEEAPEYKSNRKTQEAVIHNVKPATRYALYIKTFTILAGSTGALSDIIYFSTAPDTPGIPRQIEGMAEDSNTLGVSWLPPSRPNGKIERYTLTVTKIAESEELNLDVCSSPYSLDNRDKITRKITPEEPSQFALLPPQQQSTTTGNSVDQSTTGLPACSKTTSEVDVDIQKELVIFQDLIIEYVYLKQPCPINSSSEGSRRKRSIDYNNNGFSTNTSPVIASKSSSSNTTTTSEINAPTIQSKVATNFTSIKNFNQTLIKFNRLIGKTERNITANQFNPESKISAIIENLDHFSLYTIEIRACHGDFHSNKVHITKEYDKCSLQAVTQLRTQAIVEYDKVLPETILFNPANDSLPENLISWSKPERPNGLILAFRVRYRLKNGPQDLWTEGCLNLSSYNRDKGFILTNVIPGTYLFNVQTISMYSGSKEHWSEIEFEIPQNYLVSPAVLTILIVFGLILLALAVASGTYYYQKRQHELANGLIYASVNPDYIQYDPDEWEVDKCNLIIGAQIGTGSFGMVFKGQLNTEKGTLNCAIKTVPPTSTAKQRMDFLREASIMKQFDTYHVVKLMGVVSTTTPVYVIMEYMENGDLKSFLRSLREVYQKEKKNQVDGIYLMAAQIADGMAYLVSKKFVHRDLAARNCMVGENCVVKIGDFGLTRDIYANDYYRRDTQGRLPVRWMAPESLKDNLYTSASDVWSYGIVVWEMVTFSAYPYQGQSNDEVIKRVISGFTMSRPENCPDKLYSIMERCWKKDSRDRPSFIQIVEELLPETEGRLYPNCFYRKQKTEGDSIAQPAKPILEENNTGAESYPLLSWPSNRANGLTNGVNHVQSNMDEKKMPIP